MNNAYNTTKKLLHLLNVKHTKQFLKDAILSHQDHNSLLAISDTLSKYTIENKAIKIGEERFDELPLPCIIQINDKGIDLFYTLKSVENNSVNFYNENGKLQNQDKKGFLNQWTGVCLLAEADEKSKEPEIENKIAKQRVVNTLALATSLLIASWLFINFIDNSTFSITLYTFLKLAGLTIGFLLLWFDVDQYNPTLQSFCTGGKNVNCNAVLKSKYAKLFGSDTFSLSILGFSYFFASIITLVVSGFSSSAIGLLSYISFASLPVVFISLYYQAFVIKQWCKFCISFQIILVLESAVLFFTNTFGNIIDYKDILLFTGLFALPILAWYYLKPLLEKDKEALLYKRNLKKIKNNPFVFNSLLQKSNTIKTSTEGLGISFTNKDAKINIIKVCNPYCGPCAKAHPVLEELLRKNKINLQILFTTKSDPNSFLAKPVTHFLAIDSSNDKNLTQKVLDEWYLAEQKNYEVFANKYPLNGELQKQQEKLEKMSVWCKDQKITHTPTIFVNGYELPKEYNVADLTEIL